MLIFSIAFFGCSRTYIRVKDPSVQIYLDNEYIGQGEANIASVGPPHTAHIELRRGNQVVGRSTMKRHFHWKTVLLGVCSYYTGLYWGWYYPSEHTVLLNENFNNRGGKNRILSLWADPRQSIWMRPINEIPEDPKD